MKIYMEILKCWNELKHISNCVCHAPKVLKSRTDSILADQKWVKHLHYKTPFSSWTFRRITRFTGSTGRHKILVWYGRGGGKWEGGHIERSGELSNHFNSCQSSLAPAAAAAAAVDRGGNWWFDSRRLPATCLPHATCEEAMGCMWVEGVGCITS